MLHWQNWLAGGCQRVTADLRHLPPHRSPGDSLERKPSPRALHPGSLRRDCRPRGWPFKIITYDCSSVAHQSVAASCRGLAFRGTTDEPIRATGCVVGASCLQFITGGSLHFSSPTGLFTDGSPHRRIRYVGKIADIPITHQQAPILTRWWIEGKQNRLSDRRALLDLPGTPHSVPHWSRSSPAPGPCDTGEDGPDHRHRFSGNRKLLDYRKRVQHPVDTLP